MSRTLGPNRRCIAKGFIVAALWVLTACGGSAGPEPADDLTLAEGLSATVYATGFAGPTQMTFTDDGDLIIAELNGAENDTTGRILLVDADDPSERTVLQTDLNKPTGVAVTGDRLWIMEQRTLSYTTLVPDATRVVVADELPFNGRSEGTLTVTPSGSLLYNTSGSKRGPDRVEGSGTLFEIADPLEGPLESRVVATGFKHAYAHLVDPDAELWSVEMTDGNFDGERAQDELVAVQPGDDAGWPQCVDDNRPVIEYGGTAELCVKSPRSHALFGAGATPTSLVIAPWDDDVFVVTLWLPGEVVTVPRAAPADEPWAPTTIIDGIESPQHLLVDDDRLLVSDHETGIIYAVSG